MELAEMDIERRYVDQPVGARTGDHRTVGGYAAVFEKRSRNLGGFVEVVNRTAFNKAMGDGWHGVVARFNHDSAFTLGTTHARTLRLNVDGVGLGYEVDVPNSREDVYELVSRGDVRSSSFAFVAPRGGDEWGKSDQGYPERRLVSVQLVDVAPVSELPAYPDATAGLRSLAAHVDAPYEEVRSMAERDELRKFFVTTAATAPLSVAHARAELLSRKAVQFH